MPGVPSFGGLIWEETFCNNCYRGVSPVFPCSTILSIYYRILRDDIHIWEFSTTEEYDRVYTHDGVLTWKSD